MASQNRLRFTWRFGAILVALGTQNWRKNLIFDIFFSMSFSNVFLHRFSFDFGKLQIWKIANFLCKNNDFCKIGVFDKSTKIVRFCLRFRKPKRKKSIQNSNPKTCCFEASNLKGFFSNFRCILKSKYHQKIANIRKKWCSRASSVALSL